MKKNNKVRVGENIGTVVDFYESAVGKVVLIELENGNKIKAFASDVEIVSDELEKPERTDEITITRKEFKRIAISVAVDESKNIENVLIGFAFSIVMAELEKKLFDAPEND